MEWNRRASNVAATSSQNRQRSIAPAGSNVTNMQSQSGGQHQVLSGWDMRTKGQLIQNLLIAKTAEETTKAKQAALTTHMRLQPNPQSNQMSLGQYSSSYKPVLETVSKPNAFGVQNSLGSNCSMPPYLSTVHQTSQQQTVQVMHQFTTNNYNANVVQHPAQNSQQQFTANGYNANVVQQPVQNSQHQFTANVYNTNVVQQPVQNSQLLQNYQPSNTYPYLKLNLLQPSQNVYSTARQTANAVQTNGSQMAAKGPSKSIYDSKNSVSGQYISSQKAPTETNVSSSMPVYSQNVTSSAISNYRLSHFNSGSQQLPTVPQMDGNSNCYVQSPQRQMLQNGFNNSPQLLTTSSVKMPPAYTEAVTNGSDIFNVKNQNFTSQNYSVPNAQQPAQASTALPVQNLATSEQAEINRIIASQDRKRELLMLLQVYRNVRKKYEIVNRENNLLRERLQANSLENSNLPPLISSLPTPANFMVPEQQSQAQPVQNSPQITCSDGFKSQNAYENLFNASTQQGIQCGSFSTENPGLSNQMFKSESTNQCRQNNYSVFDGGHCSNSILESPEKETLSIKIKQEVTSGSPMGSTNTNKLSVPSSNLHNGELSQNALSIQSLNKSTSESSIFPEKTSLEYLPFSMNEPLTSVSREAIEASLPLWKTVSQSSIQNNAESQPKQSIIDLTDDTFKLLDEITFAPINEASSVVPVQKPESAVPNQANPQIAIVSPLVQKKEAVHEHYQLPKAHVQGPEAETPIINGLTNTRESECLKKILEVLESIEANTMNNSKTSKSKEHQDESRDVATLLHSISEPSPQMKLEPKSGEDIEIVDDSLQISGICTLVEGSSFYNSSVAMMFDESLQTKPAMVTTENKDDQLQTLNTSHVASPKADAVAIKTEPPDNIAHKSKDAVHCTSSPNVAEQLDKSVQSSELKSTDVSDQLSDLLTEFPYGIKNYLPEIKLDVPFGKLFDQPIFNMASVPAKDFELAHDDHSSSCMNLQTESVPKSSCEIQLETKKASVPLEDHVPVDKKQPTDLHLTSKSEPAPSFDVKITDPLMDTGSDDCREIPGSPIGDIQITILDQEDIIKFFPDEHENPVSEICNNIKHERHEQTVHTESHNVVFHSPEKDNRNDKVEDVPNQTSFCCLFSWLTYTNVNAPKCNCKMQECSKDENNKSNAFASLKSSSSSQSFELMNFCKPKVPGMKEHEVVQHTEKPPKLDLIVPNVEILDPTDKPPKLEPVVSNVQKLSHSSSTQQDKQLNRPTSFEGIQSPKETLTNVIHEKSLPISGNKKSANKNKDRHSSSKKHKSGGSRSEKLVVKTDFLKSKHHKDRKADLFVLPWADDDKNCLQNGSSKRSEGSEKKLQTGEKVCYKKVAEKAEHASSSQQSESLGTPKQFHVVEKSRRGRKRKEKESHFEKTRKVLSVQEYLERKRELCNKRSETRKEPNDGLSGDMQMLEEIPSSDASKIGRLKRPLSFAVTNLTSTTRDVQSQSSKDFSRMPENHKSYKRPYETGHRKHKNSHSSHRRESKTKTQEINSPYNKGKIYLSPCIDPRRRSDEQISVLKLQIRPSPEKPKDFERRKSLESYSHTAPSNFAIKNDQAPKMLEFKLYPEFTHGSPTTHEQLRETEPLPSGSIVEAIKSNKEAWCNAMPLKKRRVQSSDGLGISTSSSSSSSSSSSLAKLPPVYKPIDKNPARSTQDSKSTFNFFKQIYQEQRSKSLDVGLGNS